MTKQLEKVIDELSQLNEAEQNAIATLIQDELLWELSLKNSKKELSKLAQEALNEHKGKTQKKRLVNSVTTSRFRECFKNLSGPCSKICKEILPP